MHSYDQFMHRLNLIPPEADKFLRVIRQLDREVEESKLRLAPLRQSFLDKLQQVPERKTAKIRQELESDFKIIARLEGLIEEKGNEKITIAEKLYSLIHEPTEKLEKEMSQRGIDKTEEERKKRGKKMAGKRNLKKGNWDYDPNEPKYCYCGRPSFGSMVMCDNTFCELEWFHIECIDEKKLPEKEKWFCRNCRESAGFMPAKGKKK